MKKKRDVFLELTDAEAKILRAAAVAYLEAHPEEARDVVVRGRIAPSPARRAYEKVRDARPLPAKLLRGFGLALDYVSTRGDTQVQLGYPAIEAALDWLNDRRGFKGPFADDGER